MVWPCVDVKTTQVFDWIALSGRQKREQMMHKKTIEKDVTVLKADYNGARHVALDRGRWKCWVARSLIRHESN